MALDRFVYWQRTEPTTREIQYMLEDYMRGLATRIEWGGGRFTVTLPGTVSYALRRARDVSQIYREAAEEELAAEHPRTFEVFIHDNAIDVITRQVDDVTNAVAEGFTALMARFFGGRRDE